jgi:hypothetical protein
MPVRTLLVGIAALSELSVSAAHARPTWILEPHMCAVVGGLSDDWLALREADNARSRMIVKLREGDFLYISPEHNSEKGKWTSVIGVPRIDGIPMPYKHLQPRQIHGWVFNKYIQEFVCPEEQAEAYYHKSENEPEAESSPPALPPPALHTFPSTIPGLSSSIPTIPTTPTTPVVEQKSKCYPKWLVEPGGC